MIQSVSALLLVVALLIQTPAPKPSARAGAKPAAGGVDTIISLVKGGMSESLVLKTIQRENKAYSLTPADMLKLQKAGVSETIIQAMMDPFSAPAAANSPKAEVESTGKPNGSTPYPPDLPNVQRVAHKRRVAVLPFDYAAVAHWVTYWFHSDVNIGQGIRAMLTARMSNAKNVTLVERARLDAIKSELDLNNKGNTVNQGTKVKMGRVSGADCILMGDITIFGRDDTSQRQHDSGYGQVARNLGGRLYPRFGGQISQMGTFSKEEKAVVAIALRIVDTETAEVLETAEARGESSRSSKNWTVFTAGSGTYQNNSGAMESSNFQETIIGEATSDAVNKVLAVLDDKVPRLPLRSRGIEGRVAKISGNSPILGFGANEGVSLGDRFEILKIMNEVVDPATHQVLDVETVKVGELVVSNVREQIATGNYGGEILSETYPKGYTARLVNK